VQGRAWELPGKARKRAGCGETWSFLSPCNSELADSKLCQSLQAWTPASSAECLVRLAAVHLRYEFFQ
jgi:hypothetical protein